jgi:predicted enzyme related to lactoylglutathione lyase
VNVSVSDLARAIEFYQGKLGLRLLFRADEHHYASFDAGPVQLGIAEVARDSEGFSRFVGRHTGIGLAVPDIDATYRTLSAQGVKFPMPPTRQPWGGYMGLVEDPDGNVLYFDSVRDEGGA